MSDISQLSNMEKIQKQLSPPAGSTPIQGYLLKRSETLRLWNQRWFTLNPTTGKMEYRIQRGDPYPRGFVFLEADSVITLSPLNFQGDKRYDGCCIYIGSSKKREYFLCAETPGAARAWVATLRAAAVVLKAHREAVNSLSGVSNGDQVTSVAAATAIATATARESEKEVAAANRKSVMTTSTHLFAKSVSSPSEPFDYVSESLRDKLNEKDDEILKLKSELKARDNAIADLSARLAETADSAEAAASACKSVSGERTFLKDALDKLKSEMAWRQEVSEKESAASHEREAKARVEIESVRTELLKALERSGKLEAGLVMAEGLVKDARLREATAEVGRQEALREADTWRMEAFKAAKFVSAARSLAGKIEDPSLQTEFVQFSESNSPSLLQQQQHPSPEEFSNGEFRIHIPSSISENLPDNIIMSSSDVESASLNSNQTVPHHQNIATDISDVNLNTKSPNSAESLNDLSLIDNKNEH